MKYPEEMYYDSGFYDGGLGDDDISNHKEKVVKCRKAHKCSGCEAEIHTGDYALRETGFMDGAPVSCYTCLPCIEKWLEERSRVDVAQREEGQDAGAGTGGDRCGLRM